MNLKKTAFIIPGLYILLLIVFMLGANLFVRHNTQDYNEWYSILYSIGFFIVNPVSSFILALLLIAPLPLLTLAIIKKRKNHIIGFAISTAISVTLLILTGSL